MFMALKSELLKLLQVCSQNQGYSGYNQVYIKLTVTVK